MCKWTDDYQQSLLLNAQTISVIKYRYGMTSNLFIYNAGDKRTEAAEMQMQFNISSNFSNDIP